MFQMFLVLICLIVVFSCIHAGTVTMPTFAPTTIRPSASPTTIRPSVSPTLAPTAPTRSPSAVPTAVPTSFLIINPTGEEQDTPNTLLNVQLPIAKHQLVVVQPGSDALIQFTFYDSSTSELNYYVDSAPVSGSLYQLSQVFSKYGYEPKNGPKITNNGTLVTGSRQRVYYTRPTPDTPSVNMWSSFKFRVTNPVNNEKSHPGTITLVPPSGSIIGSNFLLGNEGWSITGNKAQVNPTKFEPYSRGALLNYYISGTDDIINVPSANKPDQSLWYFEAPSKYHGNYGISYGGTISFTIGAFSGDFKSMNAPQTNVIELHCADCIGPVGKGITLGFNIQTLNQSPNGAFNGEPKKITISLNENAGWLKDSQNSLQPWFKPSQCDMIQVLSRLSKIRILGDWTTWYETVAIDNVQISNTKGQLPLCAMTVPDASVCLCSGKL